MRLDEVLPELMGSLALSELLFRGEGPPWACRRMDQYQRKMRKPVGVARGYRAQRLGAAPPIPLPSTLTHVCPHSPHRLNPRSTDSAPGTGQHSVYHLTLVSPGPLRPGLVITILFYKQGD